MRSRAEAAEQSWNLFERSAPDDVRYGDVPFPQEGDIRAMAQVLGGGKKAFQTLAMRWHPDKFMNNYGKKINPNEKDHILEKVTEIFCMINSARD